LKTITKSAQEIQILLPYGSEKLNPASTIFDLFEEDYLIKLVTIKLQCPACGHTWGVKLSDYDEYHQIPDRKFICQECSHPR
jgi:hypothetical protein